MQAFKQFFSRKVALILGQTWPAETGNFCIKKNIYNQRKKKTGKKKHVEIPSRYRFLTMLN